MINANEAFSPDGYNNSSYYGVADGKNNVTFFLHLGNVFGGILILLD